jgi:hypothetical protein
VIFASFREHGCRRTKHAPIQEGQMWTGMPTAPKVDVTDICTIAQHHEHRHVTPETPYRRSVASLIEPCCDCTGSQAVVRVEVEDDWH